MSRAHVAALLRELASTGAEELLEIADTLDGGDPGANVADVRADRTPPNAGRPRAIPRIRAVTATDSSARDELAAARARRWLRSLGFARRGAAR